MDSLQISGAIPFNPQGPGSPMIGQSEAMSQVRDAIARVAVTDTTVLILGESGVGKELVARSIHAQSLRAAGPFVAVNCGSIPASLIEAELFGHEKGSFTGAHRSNAGLFEWAGGGTFFLDEITEMPLELQSRLLRVLESRRFFRVGGREEVQTTARILAATNRNPMEAVRDGKLREDLLYRLAVFPITLPALRHRVADAIEIAEARLAQLNARHGTARCFSESSQKFLAEYHWPGNARELLNAVERAYLLADADLELSPALEPCALNTPQRAGDGTVVLPLGTSLEAAERSLIEATMAHYKGSKPRAAHMLGCSVKTLYNKLHSYEAGAATSALVG